MGLISEISARASHAVVFGNFYQAASAPFFRPGPKNGVWLWGKMVSAGETAFWGQLSLYVTLFGFRSILGLWSF